jgi:hypothetical protein
MDPWALPLFLLFNFFFHTYPLIFVYFMLVSSLACDVWIPLVCTYFSYLSYYLSSSLDTTIHILLQMVLLWMVQPSKLHFA